MTNGFIEKVAEQISDKHSRKLITAELESHLLDKIDYYVDIGYSKEDAEKMASAATASQAEYDAHQAAIDSQATGFFSEFESKASSVSSSGQCINDLSVPVMGHSMTIPFSQACDFFRFLRILVLFSAYMLAARIIFGGLT